MKAQIFVTLKKSVLDPQGSTIERSLKQMGYDDLASVRIGKFIEVEVDGTDLVDCVNTFKLCVEKARAGDGPQLVVGNLLRLSGNPKSIRF